MQETVWLGNLPVATVQNGNTYAIHTDHLGTPRVITDNSNIEVWTWESDPFGVAAANDDPDGDGIRFNYNLRFPGQYYDEETGKHYNYFRDYDPSAGRYIQSDPTGLDGGFNTYLYASANPLMYIDPYGLKDFYAITTTGTGGVAIFAGEGGALALVDPCTLDVYTFTYAGGGLGLGFGAAATLDIGGIAADNPMDISGWGLAAGGFVAAGPGVTGQISGSGPQDKVYSNAGGGVAAGAGGGVAGLVTYTWFDKKYSFSNSPSFVQDALGPIRPDCECGEK